MIKFYFFFSVLFVSFTVSADELFNLEKVVNDSIENQIQLSIEKGDLELQIQDLENKIKSKKHFIVKRLKTLYALKNFQWGHLLTSTDFATFEKNIKLLKRLNENDFAAFKDYNQSLRLLVVARKNLQETDDLLKETVQELQNQQDQLTTFEQERIANLQKDNSDSFLVYKGKLSRPLDGLIIQKYGTLQDRDNKFYLINKGEIYKTKVNSLVRSIGLGTIIFSDRLPRWGETLIIQHSDNYYSVYAGIKHVQKEVGNQVVMNEWLGSTGSTEFYFELRHYDRPINPKSWFKE